MEKNMCPSCKASEKQNLLSGNLVICGVCYKSYRTKKSFGWIDIKKISIYSSLAFGLFFGIIRSGIFDSPIAKFEKIIDNSTNEEELKSTIQSCPIGKDLTCRLMIFSKLVKIRPDDLIYKANLAMALTTKGDFKKAEHYYDEIQKNGFSTYDVFASMGRNYEGLDNLDKAVEAYSNSLAIVPSLVDVVDRLAGVLVKLNKITESLSMLESFMAKYPNTEKILQGRLLSTRKLETTAPIDDHFTILRLMAVQGLHHYLQIKLSSGAKTKGFLVDTGATDLTMSTDEIRDLYQEAFKKAKPIKLRVADGRILSGFFTVIPEIQIGPWTLKNIETTFCDTCGKLVGKSVLKNFSIKSTPGRGIEFLEFARSQSF